MPTYFITGTNRGIGLEYVRQLASHPETTVFATVRSLTSSNLSDLQSIKAKNSNIHLLELDISSPTSIATLSTSIPKDTKINYIINNAGIQASKGPVTSLSLPWDSVLTQVTNNALGPAKIVETLLPFLVSDGTGVIVNISSGMGSLGLQATSSPTIPPHILPYGISKAALNLLTIHQAWELKGKVIVVTFDPGHVKTSMGGENAPLEVAESAGGVLKAIHGLKETDSGKFLRYDGKELPW